ncbi:MAG: maleylpyruvate isomerase family mycothiol-dependent enzyme [Ilumatobacteraceae bacterium]
MNGRIRALATDERADLADFLGTLSPEQWRAATLCDGWSVHDVVAHVVSYDELSFGDLLRHVVSGRLHSRRINATTMAHLAGSEPSRKPLSRLRAHLEPRGLMNFAGSRVALLEGVVHHQDIRRALGAPRTGIPSERLIAALHGALRWLPTSKGFWRVRGVRLRSPPTWSSGGASGRSPGTGEGVADGDRRTVQSVLRDELDGPGRATLVARPGAGGGSDATTSRSGVRPDRAMAGLPTLLRDACGRRPDRPRGAPGTPDPSSSWALGRVSILVALARPGPPRRRHHQGTEVSTKMAQLSTRRLERFGERATVVLVDGRSPPGCRRGLTSSCVVRLRPPRRIRHPARLLDEARRLLDPNGRLCLTSITARNHRHLSRIVTSA